MIIERDQWLTVVRPLLSGVRYDSHWAKHYCTALRKKVSQLPNQPPFLTEAEEEIKAAISVMEESLAALREAQRDFSRKPFK